MYPASQGSDDAPESSGATAHEALRRRIERAAIDVVGERGYAEASVGAICKRAVVSRERFYALFVNKDRAFAAAVMRHAHQLLGTVWGADDAAEPALERLRIAISRYFAALTSDPLAAACLLDGAAVGSPTLARERHSMRRASRDALLAVFPGATPFQCESFLAMVSHHAGRYVADGRTGDLEELTEPVVALAVGLLPA